jgi:hypothetical protein
LTFSWRRVVAEPVVIPLCLFIEWSADAPGPTLPLLEAPGAGWFCANAPPADSATMQAETKSIFFIFDDSFGLHVPESNPTR